MKPEVLGGIVAPVAGIGGGDDTEVAEVAAVAVGLTFAAGTKLDPEGELFGLEVGP